MKSDRKIDRKRWMRHVRRLKAVGMLSEEAAEVQEMYVRSRYFEMKDVDRHRLLVANGWRAWPCREMFPPDGVLEVFDEALVQVCRVQRG